jgi:hypothetical protein
VEGHDKVLDIVPRCERERGNDVSLFTPLSLAALGADFRTGFSDDRRTAGPRRWANASVPFIILTGATSECRTDTQGTTVTPIDFACEMTLLQSPSRERPDSLVSVCFILAIS